MPKAIDAVKATDEPEAVPVLEKSSEPETVEESDPGSHAMRQVKTTKSSKRRSPRTSGNLSVGQLQCKQEDTHGVPAEVEKSQSPETNHTKNLKQLLGICTATGDDEVGGGRSGGREECGVGERVLAALSDATGATASKPDCNSNSNFEWIAQMFLAQPWLATACKSKSATWTVTLTTTLEHYFSDANLSQDSYLKSLMMPEGWVSLVVLQSFPPLRVLGADTWAIRQAVVPSKELELDGTACYVRIRDNARRCRWVPRTARCGFMLPQTQVVI